MGSLGGLELELGLVGIIWAEVVAMWWWLARPTAPLAPPPPLLLLLVMTLSPARDAPMEVAMETGVEAAEGMTLGCEK